MALTIEHPEADRLARELADATGESISDAVLASLRERLERQRKLRSKPLLREEIRRIQERVGTIPCRDRRTDDEILGYDRDGLPG